MKGTNANSNLTWHVEIRNLQSIAEFVVDMTHESLAMWRTYKMRRLCHNNLDLDYQDKKRKNSNKGWGKRTLESEVQTWRRKVFYNHCIQGEKRRKEKKIVSGRLINLMFDPSSYSSENARFKLHHKPKTILRIPKQYHENENHYVITEWSNCVWCQKVNENQGRQTNNEWMTLSQNTSKQVTTVVYCWASVVDTILSFPQGLIILIPVLP